MTRPAATPQRHGGGRFYFPALADVGEPALDPPQIHHLVHVLRAAPGDRVGLFDGRGSLAEAELTAISPPRLRIVRRWSGPPPTPAVAIAVPPPAPARFDLLAEKLTELGVIECIPLRVERRPPDADRRLKRGEARWHKITVEAAAQCGNPWLPKLSPWTTPEELTARTGGDALIVAALDNDARPLQDLLRDIPPATRITAVIGPEGGFTERELTTFRSAGALCADLGPRVLRVETAALLLAAVLSTRVRA